MATLPSIALKRLVAAGAVAGIPASELAERHGYSYAGMCKLVRSKDVQAIIDEERNRVLQAAERLRLTYLMNLDQLGQRMLQIALDPAHPRGFDANKFIQECFVARRTTTESNVNIQVSQEVVRDLGEALFQVKRAYESGETRGPLRLVDGSEVFEAEPVVDNDTEEVHSVEPS